MKPTRQKIILATEQLLRQEGLARITIRKIAKDAAVAEGSLYHHFKDKAELLHAVVLFSMAEFREVLNSLPLLVGQKSVRKNLEYVLEVAFDFHFKIIPIVSSLHADHKLLVRTREIFAEREIGPQCSLNILTSYLQCEQRLGRVAKEIIPHAAAELLIGGCYYSALMDHFFARKNDPDVTRRQLHEKIDALLSGLDRVSLKTHPPLT